MNAGDKGTSNGFEDDATKKLIDDLSADEKRSQAAEDVIINKENRKELWKKILIFGGVAVLVIGIAIAVFSINPFGGEQKVPGDDETKVAITPTAEPTVEPEPTKPENTLVPIEEDEFYKKDKNRFPVETDDWQEEPFSPELEVKETLEVDGAEIPVVDYRNIKSKDIIDTWEGTSLANSSNMLPSEETGYTADPSKEFNEDGSLNPYYSYWTSEVFTFETGMHVERLLNPTVGSWGIYQYPSYSANSQFGLNSIADMFTNDWRVRNAGKSYSEYVPVYADWDSNSYGMGDQLLVSGPRWYGKVADSVSDFTYNEETFQYDVVFTADVIFTAWTQDQRKLEKTGKLTLNLVSNANGVSNSGYRVVIDDASLKVD